MNTKLESRERAIENGAGSYRAVNTKTRKHVEYILSRSRKSRNIKGEFKRKSAMVQARIEPKLKRDAENIFKEFGLNAAEAITVFYKNVQLYKGIPFALRVPNRTTRKTISDARSKKLNKLRKQQ